jgi:hypothetical protein
MAERMRIPSSPACGLWEMLLADALDGQLRAEDEATFAEHMACCPACTALFEEARRGREWLEFLAPEPEAPEGLLARILAQTGPGQVAGYGLIDGGSTLALPREIPAWQKLSLAVQVRRYAAPRLLMTAAMAFFSIALTLNLAGVRLTSLKLTDLRPTAVRSVMERRLTMASTPIVRYYDHLRLVYEVQSTMRELQRDAQGNEGVDSNEQKPKDGAPGESKTKPGHKSSSIDSMPQVADARMSLQSSTSAGLMTISLGVGRQTGTYRRLQLYGTRTEGQERSKVWTA